MDLEGDESVAIQVGPPVGQGLKRRALLMVKGHHRPGRRGECAHGMFTVFICEAVTSKV